MNEESTLALNIQAKILPQIEGAQQFEQQLREIPNTIRQSVDNLSVDKVFTEGMTNKDISAMKTFATTQDMLSFEKFKDIQDDILYGIKADIKAETLTEGQSKHYVRKIALLEKEIEKYSKNLIEDIYDPQGIFSDFSADKKKMMSDAIIIQKDEAIKGLDSTIDKFKSMKEEIKAVNNETENFFAQLQRAGVFAIGGMVVNEGLKWFRTGAEIEARDMTSFDLTSPIGMYSERRMFDVYKDTAERSRDFGLLGTGIGLGGGLLAAAIPGVGPLAAVGMALGGAYFGGSVGSNIADIFFNKEETAEAQEEIKRLNQTHGILSGYVKSSESFDIGRARLRAGYGNDIIGITRLGYTPEQELAMRSVFGSQLGRFDEDLYTEQTTFARATGIDPNQVYQLNSSGRMTGVDYGIGGLARAEDFTKSLFGNNASPQRVIDVLNEIKSISEQRLKRNIERDEKQSFTMLNIPRLIFGDDSPYGRPGEMAGATIQGLQGLMNPKSQAHEAFLFQAFGETDILKFTERMKGGIFSGNNLADILDKAREYGGKAEYALQAMLPETAQGFVPELAKLLGSGERYGSFRSELEKIKKDFDRDPEKVKDLLNEYNVAAKDAISRTEETAQKEGEIRVTAARRWMDTINEARIEMAKFWESMGTSSKLHEEIVTAQRKGFENFNKWRYNKGFFTEEEISEGIRGGNKAQGLSPGGMFKPHTEVEKDSQVSEDVIKFRNAVDRFQDSVDSLKHINITVNNDADPANVRWDLIAPR